MSKITMYHPDAGTMQCSASAVSIHERSGWVRSDGISAVTLSSAAGDTLTTGTVFPPESFDDDQASSSEEADGLDGAAEPSRPTKATRSPKSKEV